ncbi:TPR repeat-containing protein YrrB [Methanobrevibacter cuticularis]|uniref:TPR repeat-containing protein YrrB n=1 Tax=Methanobrevibacter cuticularis TaxID=47311 RepID=A0A166ED71_9EURY|nr:hypothetical protein [Methanobrevibacter cuticularis]KZX16526.1 TPR repeat-containing protein YrrB [Methanobrevibacter cuticularis]
MFSFIKNRRVKRLSDKATKLMKKGDYGAALSHFRKAVKLDNYNEYCLINIGYILDLLSDGQIGIEWYDVVLKLNPDNANALSFKGLSLGLSGKFNESLENYKKVLKILNDDEIKKCNPTIFSEIASVYLGLDNPKCAMKYLKKGLKIDPYFLITICSVGKVFNYLGDFNEAITYFDRAISLKTSTRSKTWHYDKYTFIYSGKAVALFKLGKYEDVLSLLDKALDIREFDVYALYWKHKVLKFFNEDEEAEKYSNLLDIFDDDYIDNFKVVGLIYE